MNVDDFINGNGEEEKPRRGFTGWFIPVEMVELFDEGVLNAKELLLLAEIDSLSKIKQKNGLWLGCFAGNKHLADKIHIKSAVVVSRMISKFKKLGLVIEDSFDGRKRYLFTRWSYVLKKAYKSASKKLSPVERD